MEACAAHLHLPVKKQKKRFMTDGTALSSLYCIEREKLCAVVDDDNDDDDDDDKNDVLVRESDDTFLVALMYRCQ